MRVNDGRIFFFLWTIALTCAWKSCSLVTEVGTITLSVNHLIQKYALFCSCFVYVFDNFVNSCGVAIIHSGLFSASS